MQKKKSEQKRLSADYFFPTANGDDSSEVCIRACFVLVCLLFLNLRIRFVISQEDSDDSDVVPYDPEV